MKLLYMLLGLTLQASPLQADSMTTIQLQHRPAEEIIPIIEPMLGTGDVITGRGFKLLLRSSPQTLAEVKDMIDVLDSASKILQISVFQGSERHLRTLGINSNIQIESDDVSGSAGTKSNDSAGSISYHTSNASGRINATGTSGQMQNNPLQRLRVTEGREAYIETGERIPYFSGAGWSGSRAAAGDIEYRNISTGFYVLPRIHGDNVSLQVSQFRNSLREASGGKIATRQANTAITGRLGEWLLIGGTTEQITRSQNGIGSYGSTQNSANDGIWIKADLVQ